MKTEKIKMFEGVCVKYKGKEQYFKDLEAFEVYNCGEAKAEVIRALIINFPYYVDLTKDCSMRIVSERETKENNIVWEEIK